MLQHSAVVLIAISRQFAVIHNHYYLETQLWNTIPKDCLSNVAKRRAHVHERLNISPAAAAVVAAEHLINELFEPKTTVPCSVASALPATTAARPPRSATAGPSAVPICSPHQSHCCCCLKILKVFHMAESRVVVVLAAFVGV